MMFIKRIEYVSSSKDDPRSSDLWACSNHDLSFRVDALKSPFIKGDLEAVGQPSKVPSCHSERSEESYKPCYLRLRDSSAHASE